MSISNPSHNSPVNKYIEWSARDGQFNYWDKEQKARIPLPDPFKIIVLDELYCVRGYNESEKKRVYSNEIRDIKNDELRVTYEGGESVVSGVYSEIKNAINLNGARYNTSVYAALVVNAQEVEIINIKLSGSSLTPWIEANISSNGNTVKVSKNQTPINTYETPFYIPSFEEEAINQDALTKAIELDKQLQPYLNSKLRKLQPPTTGSTDPNDPPF